MGNRVIGRLLAAFAVALAAGAATAAEKQRCAGLENWTWQSFEAELTQTLARAKIPQDIAIQLQIKKTRS
jgi:hypothetical protein